MTVRCGQCVGCRLYRSREWALRMTHESQLYPTNCTLTLTYDHEHLPENGTLVPTHHSDFIKRLRKRTGRKIRYFHCGEYGEGELRPHYHTVLFGYDFPDKRYFKDSRAGFPLYNSPLLDSLWGLGHALIGSLTFNSAQYVAKYATKTLNVTKGSDKETNQKWKARYERIDPRTGVVHQVVPEYATMSRKPGIGREWLRKFWPDIYPSDYCVLDGKKMPVPRYYDKILERENPELFAQVKRERLNNRDKSNDAAERLRAMEACTLARTNLNGGRA